MNGGRLGSALNPSKSALFVPGPGSYNVSKDFGQDALKVSILGKPKDNNKNLIPGPGQYETKDDLTKCKPQSFR